MHIITGGKLHLVTVETDTHGMHRAVCSCGFRGIARSNTAHAHESGEAHKAREAGEIPSFGALAAQVGR